MANISEAKVFGISPWNVKADGIINENLDFSEKGSGDPNLPAVIGISSHTQPRMQLQSNQLELTFNGRKTELYAKDLEDLLGSYRTLYNIVVVDLGQVDASLDHLGADLEVHIPQEKRLRIVRIVYSSIDVLFEGAKEGIGLLTDIIKNNFKYIVSKRYREVFHKYLEAEVRQQEAKAAVSEQTVNEETKSRRERLRQSEIKTRKAQSEYEWEQINRAFGFLNAQIEKASNHETKKYLQEVKAYALRVITENKLTPIIVRTTDETRYLVEPHENSN